MRLPLLKRPGQRIACQDLVELVTAYLEDTLPGRTRRRFEDHLTLCDGCAGYVEQYRETIRLTGTLTAEQIEPEARDRLLEAFRGWRDEDDGTDGAVG